MSIASQRRYRQGRGGFPGARGALAGALAALRRGDVLVRLLLCALAAVMIWAVTGAWTPPFSYRLGFIPRRDIMTRVDFSVKDENATKEKRDEARRSVVPIYKNDPQPLVQLRQELTDRVSQLVLAESFDKIDKQAWSEFAKMDAPPDEQSRQFNDLKSFFTGAMNTNRFADALRDALAPMELSGMLREVQSVSAGVKPTQIRVRTESGRLQQFEISEVRIANIGIKLKNRLEEEFRLKGGQNAGSPVVADLAFRWLYDYRKLPETLRFDGEATGQEADRLAAEVPDQTHKYTSGVDELVAAGKPLDQEDLKLLKQEYEQWNQQTSLGRMLSYTLAKFGMYVALAVLCGFYIFHRSRVLLTDLRKFATLVAAVVITVALCSAASEATWSAEMVPLLLFGMTAAIAYEKELALLLAASVALIVAFSLEQGLGEFVILVSSVAAAILLLRRIRSRTKLIYVGAVSGLVVLLTTIGVGTVAGHAFGASSVALNLTEFTKNLFSDPHLPTLLASALWFGFCAQLAGLLMTGLLPFIERMFDVQTDISLLELGDVQHPLLQELVRRAPGTYNHSINVASIAETAAEAIGVNGLLVRVGAYFHDIGKMLKPAYFVENQGPEGNRHESLQPAMSTLVIIAHVKDGVDLARQHSLPQSIIDFIEQHHGTTLVEYFYRREAKRLESDPDAGELDESTFRYPGPKPQTKDAAVLMLADVVESASRALSDPTPARIESLVHDLALKRLLDGQFDECGLTLSELRSIEDSLVKSLTAVYHGRVRYPEHQTV
ncbi:MAG TPA: HDIG domain-containing protein [Pirellulaceae bacterium]|nr:HDIG domain-containing protein [Pirellulaceae bacterium]